MNFHSLGRVSVSSPGTPVQVSTTPLSCSRVIFAQKPGASGNVYIGVAGMNYQTSAGVLFALLPPGTSGLADLVQISEPGNSIDLNQFWIDADTAGQGPLVSYAVE